MSECFIKKGCNMSTKSIDEEIKELVNISGAVRMDKVLCLVAKRLTETGEFMVTYDPENYTILTKI